MFSCHPLVQPCHCTKFPNTESDATVAVSNNRCHGSNHFSVTTFKLSVSQVDWESNGGLVKKLPSIREDEEGDEEQSSVSCAPRSPLRLSRGLNSPLRSPLLPPRPFRAPSEHSRPTTLQIPVVSFSSVPPELSPR